MSIDFLPKKSLGQHWLKDEAVLEAMCGAVQVKAGDVVLEIGPGLGTLTDRLLARGAEVLALEIDRELIGQLLTKYQGQPASEIFIQEGDIRSFDFGDLPDVYKIVANIPYYLSAHLLRLLTERATHKPQQAALLLQREVAERVAAQPGATAFISVAAQFYYAVSLGQVVPAELFTPAPKVDSQILILKLRTQPLFEVDTTKFFRLVKAGFAQRRKTLANSASGGLRIERAEAVRLIESAGVLPNVRAQALSMEDWHRLYQTFTPLLSPT